MNLLHWLLRPLTRRRLADEAILELLRRSDARQAAARKLVKGVREAGELSEASKEWINHFNRLGTVQPHHFRVRMNKNGHPGITMIRNDGTVDCAFHLPSVEALAEFVTHWTPDLPDDDLKSLICRLRRDKPSPQTQSEHSPSDSSDGDS